MEEIDIVKIRGFWNYLNEWIFQDFFSVVFFFLIIITICFLLLSYFLNLDGIAHKWMARGLLTFGFYALFKMLEMGIIMMPF